MEITGKEECLSRGMVWVDSHASYGKFVKGFCRRKPEWKFRKPIFVEQSRKVMGDNIALNGDEKLISKEYGIPAHTVFVRSDWYNDPEKMKRLKTHESVEMYLMEHDGMAYKKAHQIANKFEHNSDRHIPGRK